MKPKHTKQFPVRPRSTHCYTSTEKAKLKKKRKKKFAQKQSACWTVEANTNATKKNAGVLAIRPCEPQQDMMLTCSVVKPSKCVGHVSEKRPRKEKSAKKTVGPFSLDVLRQLDKSQEASLFKRQALARSSYAPLSGPNAFESVYTEGGHQEPSFDDERESDYDEEQNAAEAEYQSDYDEESSCNEDAYLDGSVEDDSSNEGASSASEKGSLLEHTELMESPNRCHTPANSTAYPADCVSEEERYSLASLYPERNKHTLKVFRLQERLLLAFVRLPTVLRLTGRATLRVLYGAVDIDGYVVTPGNPLNTEGLFVQCGLLSSSTTMRPMAPQSDSVYSKLIQELQQLAPAAWDTVSPHFDRNATVVLLKKAEGRWPAVELVIAGLAKLPELKGNHAGLGFDLKSSKDDDHPWSLQFPGLATKLIKAATSAEQQIPHVVVCGHKNSGKSTLLRLLTNSLLNVCHGVIYLDCDPGQTEFSPPGTLSLVKVTSPLLGPPFTHPRTPEKMYFLGDVTPASCPDSYSTAVRFLVEYKNQHFENYPLVVNTMGWLSGIGLSLLVDVIRWVNPTDLVQLAPALVLSGSVSSTDLPLLSASTVHMACGWLSSRSEASQKGHETVFSSSFASHHFRAFSGSTSSQPELMRQGMLLSYLSQMQHSSAFCPWSSTPYRLPWSSVAIHEYSCSVQKNDLLYVLNASVVALCVVSKELLLETEVEGYPMFMKGNPPYECVGFGIIRAIDPKEKVFYILTPEPKHRLSTVNALIKGCISTPEVLLTNQARFMKKGQSFPYIVKTSHKEKTSCSDNDGGTWSKSK